MPVEDRLLILGLRADGAHGVTEVAVAVEQRPIVPIPTPTFRMEVEAVREVFEVVQVERGRPVGAVRTGNVEVTILAYARSWEEKLTSVISSHKDTIHSILLSKS